MRNLLIVALLSSFWLGCGKLSQDPYNGLPDTSNKPGNVPEEKPGDPNAIRPRTSDGYNFVLEQEQQIQIEATILVENYQVVGRIENLNAFPGATYDASTGIFTWKPTRDFFSDELKRTQTLGVVFIGTSTDGKTKVYRRDWPVQIEVTRTPEQPGIVDASQFPAFVDEGGYIDLWFEVADADAGKSIDLFPELVLNHQTKSNELAPFITISPAELIRSGNFRYSVRLDLRNVELTNTSKSFSVSFSPQSRYGVMGGAKVWELTVVSSLSSPVSSWTDEVTFQEGVETKCSFYLVNPKGEGSLSLGELKELPPGASLTCKSEPKASMLLCDFTWKPAVGDSKLEFKPTMGVNTTLTYGTGKTKERPDSFDLKLKVTPATPVAKGVRK